VDRFQVMTCNSKEIVNRAVDPEKSLKVSHRLESTHLAFLFPGGLVGEFNSVVLVLPGSMGDGWENLSVRSRIASELVRNELQRWPLLALQDLAKEAFGSSLVSVARGPRHRES